jgi:hypothetical protein
MDTLSHFALRVIIVPLDLIRLYPNLSREVLLVDA